MRELKEYLKDEDGSEIVSLVLVLPLFVYIFAMIVSFSQVVYAKTAALNAATAAARVAILQSRKDDAQQMAQDEAARYIASTGMGVTMNSATIYADTWKRAEICTCVVDVSVSTAAPMSLGGGGGINGSYQVQGVCPMMIEKGAQ